MFQLLGSCLVGISSIGSKTRQDLNRSRRSRPHFIEILFQGFSPHTTGVTAGLHDPLRLLLTIPSVVKPLTGYRLPKYHCEQRSVPTTGIPSSERKRWRRPCAQCIENETCSCTGCTLPAAHYIGDTRADQLSLGILVFYTRAWSPNCQRRAESTSHARHENRRTGSVLSLLFVPIMIVYFQIKVKSQTLAFAFLSTAAPRVIIDPPIGVCPENLRRSRCTALPPVHELVPPVRHEGTSDVVSLPES